jgi:hypothetical protein
MHTIEQAKGSKDLDFLVLGNHDEINGVQEISINYTSSRELLIVQHNCQLMLFNHGC